MFRQVVETSELKAIEEELKPHREKCLYLYCNIVRYGVGNPNFRIYHDQDSGNIIGTYFGDSAHVFVKQGIDESVAAFIEELQPRTIFSSDRLGDIVQMNEEITGVYQLSQCSADERQTSEIQVLSDMDIESLTDFLYTYSAEYQKVYARKTLEAQLRDRLRSGYCHYFGVYRSGELVGCAFTKAEIDDLIITGGILVSPECRGSGLGKALCQYEGQFAMRSDKASYCFIDETNRISINLHESVGYRKVDSVYKYINK